MKLGQLITLLVSILTIVSVIFEHKFYDWVGMFSRQPESWSIVNIILIIISVVLFIITFGEQITDNWDTSIQKL